MFYRKSTVRKLIFLRNLGHRKPHTSKSLIGVLRWVVELVRVDICNETIMMSSHLVLPRRGHLERLFHMFSYLNKHQNSKMLFNPTDPDVDMADFHSEDLGLSIYGNFKADIPPIVSFAESGPGDMP